MKLKTPQELSEDESFRCLVETHNLQITREKDDFVLEGSAADLREVFLQLGHQHIRRQLENMDGHDEVAQQLNHFAVVETGEHRFDIAFRGQTLEVIRTPMRMTVSSNDKASFWWGLEKRRAGGFVVGCFSIVEALFPCRLTREELGDALEFMNARPRPACLRALKVISVVFWVSINAIREVTSALGHKKAS